MFSNKYSLVIVSFVFFLTCGTILSASQTIGSLDHRTYLGAYENINHIIGGIHSTEFQKVLGEYYSLLAVNELHEPESSATVFGNYLLLPAVKKKDGRGATGEEKVGIRERRSADANVANILECEKNLERLFQNISTNRWTWPFLDAWGKPGPSILLGRLNFVGSYRQCLAQKAPPTSKDSNDDFTGNYCVLSVAGAGGSSTLLGTASLQVGACVPSSCSEEDLTMLLQLAIISLNKSSTLQAAPTECRNDEREYTSATIAAIVILSTILALMVCGTLVDLLVIQRPTWSSRTGEVGRNGPQVTSRYHPIPDEEKAAVTDMLKHNQAPVNEEPTTPKHASQDRMGETRPLLSNDPEPTGSSGGVVTQMLLAFSVYTNGSKALGTNQPSGSLSSINGIRCLSMSWVVLGHMYVFGLGDVENIAEVYPTLLNRWTFDAVSNALVSVDTFFTLSGLLVAYLTTKEMMKKGWKINWGLFYFHRFWRLTPPYMLVLLIVLGLQRFFGSGALWPKVQPVDKAFCEENWWTNLLYVNNLVNAEQQCFGHAWYLANDMQFYIISPIMLLAFYFNKYAGIVSCSVFLLAQWITAGILSADNEWPASAIATTTTPAKPGSLSYMTYYYITPYCRIGPYVIGILTGYLLATCKGRVRMNKVVVTIGWMLSIATALAAVYGLRGDISGKYLSSVEASAFYNAVARSAWGACICWVIVACCSGYGGPVNTLLSWRPFVALSRLTYMAYLIHPCVMYVYFGNQETPYHLNDTNIVISFLGILLFTYMASFVLMLGLESPMIALEKVFFSRSRH